MQVTASLSGPYPVRQGGAGGDEGGEHSLRCTAADRRKLYRLYQKHYAALSEDKRTSRLRRPDRAVGPRAIGRPFEFEQVAQAFAAYARQLHAQSGRVVSELHVEAAFALMHRRVEAIPGRLDRALICGMTAVALADAGNKVHLLVDNALAIPWLERSAR